MSEYGPVKSALDAEQAARQAVEAARQQAVEIRRRALAEAHAIDRRTQEKVQRLHSAVDEQIEAQREAIEHAGASAMRRLRSEAIDPGIMNRAVARLVDLIMVGNEESD